MWVCISFLILDLYKREQEIRCIKIFCMEGLDPLIYKKANIMVKLKID